MQHNVPSRIIFFGGFKSIDKKIRFKYQSTNLLYLYLMSQYILIFNSNILNITLPTRVPRVATGSSPKSDLDYTNKLVSKNFIDCITIINFNEGQVYWSSGHGFDITLVKNIFALCFWVRLTRKTHSPLGQFILGRGLINNVIKQRNNTMDTCYVPTGIHYKIWYFS